MLIDNTCSAIFIILEVTVNAGIFLFLSSEQLKCPVH